MHDWFNTETSSQLNSSNLLKFNDNMMQHTKKSSQEQVPSVFSVVCSPVSQSWAISTTSGVYIISHENMKKMFDVGVDDISNNIVEMIENKAYSEAVSTALKLKMNKELLHLVICKIPYKYVKEIIQPMPQAYILALLEVLWFCLSQSKHITMTLCWLQGICTTHQEVFEALPRMSLKRVLSQLIDLQVRNTNINKNRYDLDYICQRMRSNY